jgi:plasmid maintenance system antidote protein VapI
MTTENDVSVAPADGFALEPVHPGEVLQEELVARGLTTKALALKLGVPATA